MREFLGLGGLILRSSDPARLRAFYERALGFRFAADGDGGWQSQVGSTHFGISPAPAGAVISPSLVTWSVDDLDATVARLHHAGIDVRPSAADFWSHCDYHQWVHFDDPDGHRVIVQAVDPTQRGAAVDERRALAATLVVLFGDDPRIAERLETCDPRALANPQLQAEALAIYARRAPLDETLDALCRVFSWAAPR